MYLNCLICSNLTSVFFNFSIFKSQTLIVAFILVSPQHT